MVLHVTGAFRFVVSPPDGRSWPPTPNWSNGVREAADEWREGLDRGTEHLPELVSECWDLLTHARHLPLEKIATGADWPTCAAILTLHAVVDETMACLEDDCDEHTGSLGTRAWQMVRENGSISRFPTSGIRILPKTHLSQGGVNLRSISRHLSSHVSPVDVSWTRIPIGDLAKRREDGLRWNVLLLPWPLEVADTDFGPSARPVRSMDPSGFGWFRFHPQRNLDLAYVQGALEACQDRGSPAHAVVLPEAAVVPEEVPLLERLLLEHGATFLATGVRQAGQTAAHLGENYAHIGLWNHGHWTRCRVDKHHRWFLDASQIDQYGLSAVLTTDKVWWDAISIPQRRVMVLDLGGGTTTSVLICEDLARLDEVAEVLRYVGPSIVIALLLDGPQLANRWSSRYASVLADDPGSAVLTLTALGMATRSRYAGQSGCRVIALWKDPERGLREVALDPEANAALLTLEELRKTVWTADGRCHRGITPRLVLQGVEQITVTNAPVRTSVTNPLPTAG